MVPPVVTDPWGRKALTAGDLQTTVSVSSIQNTQYSLSLGAQLRPPAVPEPICPFTVLRGPSIPQAPGTEERPRTSPLGEQGHGCCPPSVLLNLLLLRLRRVWMVELTAGHGGS